MSKAAALSLPPPPPEVAHLVEQLQRHHLAPDASLLSNSVHSDLLQVRRARHPPVRSPPPFSYHCFRVYVTPQAREEVAAERARYLEALVSAPARSSDLDFRVCTGSDQILCDAVGGVRGGGGDGGGVPARDRSRWRRRRQEAQLLPEGSTSPIL